MKRSTNIDLCRGLLFVLMANTHALSLIGVPSEHWLFSDLWLPSGWATVVFVVLSGFSVGFVCSDRKDLFSLEPRLVRRSGQIISVMLLSNTVFAILREFVGGTRARVATLDWWLGFVTLDTPWTISGVLLPTALVVAIGVLLARIVRRYTWGVLPLLILLRVSCSWAQVELEASTYAHSWMVRFFLTEGLGGFPVLPFVLNGCIGVWLGVLRNRSELQWRAVIGLLLALQLGVYSASFTVPDQATRIFMAAAGPVGKFAWMFLLAHLLKLAGTRVLAEPIELIGTFALGSFVMHRVFLQALILCMGAIGARSLSLELQYVLLLSLTLFLTWGLCKVRQRLVWVDLPFRRFAM